MDHNTIAIIPACSGSKGIPNKNPMQLAGRSILDWTASAAGEALGAQNVVVSSDGDAILVEARKLGVRTHRRSAEAGTSGRWGIRAVGASPMPPVKPPG